MSELGALMKTSYLNKMVELRQAADLNRCRVKTWKLTDMQAILLSSELGYAIGRLPNSIYDGMKAGNSFLFGARVIIQ